MADQPSPSRLCFACGDENPRGLGMVFRMEGERAVADFAVPDYLQGYPGQAHGGGVATMLDEAMGWATYGRGIWAMTARFEMRFRRKVPLGVQLTVTGWVTRDRGRFLELRSELRTQDGTLLAEADGLFARVNEQQGEEMRRAYEGDDEPGTGRQTETMTSLQDGRR